MTMSPAKKIAGVCGHCSSPTEFTAETIGGTIVCPFCRHQTEFHLPKGDDEPVVPRSLVRWTVAAIIILLLGMGAVMVALKYGERKAAEYRETHGLAEPGKP